MKEETNSNKFKDILEWAVCILIALIIAILFRYFIGTPTIVQQPSMFNTLEPGQRLILNRWIKTVHGKFNRGDIVTFEAPSYSEYNKDESIPSAYQIDINNPVHFSKYNNKRDILIKEKKIVNEGDKYILKVNLEFMSPSGAAGFALGGSVNGWVEWKNKEGKTLDEVIRKK